MGWRSCGVRQQGAGGPGEWQLYNLRNDPAELHDLSKEQPERFKAMLVLWDEYVKTNGVILTNSGPFASGPATPAIDD